MTRLTPWVGGADQQFTGAIIGDIRGEEETYQKNKKEPEGWCKSGKRENYNKNCHREPECMYN